MGLLEGGIELHFMLTKVKSLYLVLECFHQLWVTARWIWGLSDDKEIRMASWGTSGKNKTKQNKNNQNQNQKKILSYDGAIIKQI